MSGIEISLWYLFYEVSETHDPPEKVYPQSRVKDFWEWKSELIHFEPFPLWWESFWQPNHFFLFHGG